MRWSRRVRFAVVAAVLAQAGIAVASYVGLVLAERSGWAIFRSVDRPMVFADVALYRGYASRVVAGEVPYRDFRVEYPALAVPFFVLPRLVAAGDRAYVVGFALEMLIANALTLALLARWIDREEGSDAVPGRLAWSTLAFATIAPFAIGRFDAVPAAIGFGSACTWASGRNTLGGTLAGLGTLVKIAPGAVAVPALGWEIARTGRPGRGSWTFGIVLVVGWLGWSALAGGRAGESLRYHTERGLEIGSPYAAALTLIGKMRGSEVSVVYDHASMSIEAPGAETAAALAFPIQVLALGLVGWRAWRTGGREPIRDGAAALLAFGATGKVLSPQYLIWVLPFVAALPGPIGRRSRTIFLAAGLATMVLEPWAFRSLAALETWGLVVLAVRDFSLLGLLGLLLLGDGFRGELERSGRP